MTVKKGYLKLIYVCALYSEYENAKSLSDSVLDEMM